MGPPSVGWPYCHTFVQHPCTSLSKAHMCQAVFKRKLKFKNVYFNWSQTSWACSKVQVYLPCMLDDKLQ